jgi:hypothetical protein
MQQKLSLLQSGGDTPWFLMSFTYISILRNLIFVLCWGLLEACENFSDSILFEGCEGPELESIQSTTLEAELSLQNAPGPRITSKEMVWGF